MAKTYLQDFVPVSGQLWPASHRLVPYDGEVGHAAEVLCHCDRVVQVENNMPPATGDEYSLTRPLENLQLNTHRLIVSVCTSDKNKPCLTLWRKKKI